MGILSVMMLKTLFVADFIVDIAGGEHRPLAALDVALVEAALDSALALPQLSAYLTVHSKSLVWCGR
jgi:hypothetical protein